MSATTELRVKADASDAIAEVRRLRAEVAALRSELDQARSPRVSILREPLTYEARLVADPTERSGFRAISTREDHSYIADLVLHQQDGHREAFDRLQRHQQEMRTLAEARERIFHPDVDYEFEQRAVNWTSGAGGYFAPPLWIVEQFAKTPVPERVLSRLAPQFELPQGAQSVSVPRWSAGADIGATQLGAAATSQDPTDTAISSAVATFAGNFDAPMQMLEQSPQGAHFDWVAFEELDHKYAYKLELQLLTGTGSATPQGSGNSQLLGILNHTGIPTASIITYTDATPTGPKLIQIQGGGLTAGGAIPQMIAATGNARRLRPELVMMTTSRAAWIAQSEISMFPLAVSNQTGPGRFDLLAYPVELNDAIPTNLGTGFNQDTIIFCRPSDWLILESERHTSVFTAVLSGTLTARIQMRRYAAALLRQPTSVAYSQGTGMIVQPGF